ncbi:MAG: hypothetical protein M0R22_05950 [Dehalococcoidia bacterium]|jgi:hypothetical protein|nr:hypothetical protein [Dehalococcoidia bacterium]
MMKRLVSLALFCAVLAALVPPVGFVAADDPPDDSAYLNDAEEAYIKKLNGAFGAARGALDVLTSQIDSAVGSALFGGGPGPAEMVGNVATCKGTLAAQASVFREAPPPSFASLASTNTAIAARCEGSFGPTFAIVGEEAKNRLLDAARDKFGGFFAGVLGVGPAPEKQDSGITVKLRFVASVNSEIAAIKALLDAGQGALNAKVGEVVEDAEAGSEGLEWPLGEDCFIATAAYGTGTAVEIDVLRRFRDQVLFMSPSGRDYIGFYYAASPPVADFIARHELLRTVVRECIVDPIVRLVSLAEPLWQPA